MAEWEKQAQLLDCTGPHVDSRTAGQAANYDGVLGVAFLIGLPLLVWAIWKFDLAVQIKIIAGLAEYVSFLAFF